MGESISKRWFLNYIRDRLKIILINGLFVLIFAVVFSLSGISLEPVWYSALLCGTAYAVIFVFDLFCNWKKQKQMEQLNRHKLITLEGLPKPSNMMERNYQTIIYSLYEDRASLTLSANKRQQEIIEYFTLWAHQTKTPLAAMGLLLQSEEGSYKEWLQQELFVMEQYVDMALQYLRLEEKTSDFLIKPYDLNSIVKQSIRVYSKFFIYKHIALSFGHIQSKVITDEKWLVFVIKQLLSNGLKYTSKGKISIYMETGKANTLVIEDTGIGIASEDISRVFERGFTGFNGRMDKKSTGIGLFLCKRAMDRLNHKISIESVAGEGTKVFLDLSSDTLEIE